MTTKPLLLAFIEDPGAANAVAPTVEPLRKRGWRVELLADGLAFGMLDRRGLAVRVPASNESAQSILEETAPDVLLLGTSDNRDSLAFALVDASRAVQVPSVALVDARMNAEHRFRGSGTTPLQHAPDWLLVPDSWTRDQYGALGFPHDRVLICGRPHEDFVLQRRRVLAHEGRSQVKAKAYQVAPPEKVVLFVSEGAAGRLYLGSVPGSANPAAGIVRVGRMESTLDALLSALNSIDPRPRLFLRPHPKDGPDAFSAFAGRLDGVVRSGDPLDLVFGADLVVGCTSSLLGEAALLGTRVLAMLPKEEEASLLPRVLGSEGIPWILRGAPATERLRLLLDQGPVSSPAQVSTGSAARVADLIVSIMEQAGVEQGSFEGCAPRLVGDSGADSGAGGCA